jgi:hypothetical protein
MHRCPASTPSQREFKFLDHIVLLHTRVIFPATDNKHTSPEVLYIRERLEVYIFATNIADSKEPSFATATAFMWELFFSIFS